MRGVCTHAFRRRNLCCTARARMHQQCVVCVVRTVPAFWHLTCPWVAKMQSPSNEGLSMSAVVCARALMRRWPTFPLGPAGGGCQDQPDFLDSEGEGCDDHVTFGYCVDGGYGPGWDATWGQFSDYAVDGIDASQACCACGGGNVLGPGALGPGKGRARFSIPMPSVSYGQPALYKKMRAGDSPMWKSNTRYNQTHESRIPHIVQPSLFGDTAFFTASGDLFLQTMRHEFPHAIQNEESTRTPRMNEMFKNILAASKTADDLYAPGLGDAGFDYLTKFPEVFASLLSFPSAGVVSCPPARCPPLLAALRRPGCALMIKVSPSPPSLSLFSLFCAPWTRLSIRRVALSLPNPMFVCAGDLAEPYVSLHHVEQQVDERSDEEERHLQGPSGLDAVRDRDACRCQDP